MIYLTLNEVEKLRDRASHEPELSIPSGVNLTKQFAFSAESSAFRPLASVSNYGLICFMGMPFPVALAPVMYGTFLCPHPLASVSGPLDPFFSPCSYSLFK